MQSLLCVLAVGRDVVELGTAFGEGAAALAETARSVVTVELDPERAAAARERLAGIANVELREGDWRDELRGLGPFGLLFYDAGPVYDIDAALALLEPGGLLVKDDLTPGWEGPDPWRDLVGDPRVAAVEILTTPASAAIVAAKLS